MKRRSGLVAIKLGMSNYFNAQGEAKAVTILKVVENCVLRLKTAAEDGYDAVVMAYGKNKLHRIKKPIRGMAVKAGFEPFAKIKEFRVTSDMTSKVGDRLLANHFYIGQHLDVTGKSTGKGFAGAMKRHNFGGIDATHGVSLTHRAHGSTGQRQDAGRVFKNKKMAGHLGNETATVQNLRVIKIDQDLDLIVIAGAVPGKKGCILYVRDALKKANPAVTSNENRL